MANKNGLIYWLLLPMVAYVSGNCQSREKTCRTSVTNQGLEVASLLSTMPALNSVQLTKTCQDMKNEVVQCKSDLERLCGSGNSREIDNLQSKFDSFCGPDKICPLMAGGCSGIQETMEISRLMASLPHDVALIRSKCTAVMSKGKSCLQELPDECGPFTADMHKQLNSLCGPSTLCQMSVGVCQGSMTVLANSSGPGDMGKMCKVVESLERCLQSEVNAECRALPTIQSLLGQMQAVTSPYKAMCGQGSGGSKTCPQLFGCMSQSKDGVPRTCSKGMGDIMKCLSELREQCDVDESTVTFQEVKEQMLDMCHAMEGREDEASGCQAMNECLKQSDLVQSVMTQISDVGKLSATMLNAQNWCSYMELGAECVVSSADSCSFDEEYVQAFAKQLPSLHATCSGTVLTSSAMISNQDRTSQVPGAAGSMRVNGWLLVVLITSAFTKAAIVH